MAQSGRRLTARPAESEHPGTEINIFLSNNIYLIANQKRLGFKRLSF
jgi:hypothetical protein